MKKQLTGIGFSFILSLMVNAQVAAVKLVVQIPESIHAEKNIYLAGSFNHWSAKDSLYQLKRISENIYAITIPVFDGVKYEYKYTLGSWDEVEMATSDSAINNRSFLSSNNKMISDTVVKWRIPPPKNTDQPAQKFQPLKDSLVASLQAKQNEMLGLLKQYLINQLQEKPSVNVNQKITDEVVKNLSAAYASVDRAASKILSELTPAQKQKILKAITEPGEDKDIINKFLGAYSEAIKK